MKSPHVVHIIPTLAIGGAERFVVSLCQHIAASDVRQSIVILWDDAPLADTLPEEVTLHAVHIDTIAKYRRIATLSALLQRIEADVVHTHLFSADLWGRLAARRLGLPVVTTEHNVNHAEPLHWRLIKRGMKGFSDIYTAPSGAVADYMQQHYGIGSAQIQIIPHGIATRSFADIPLPRHSDRPTHLLVLGRLVEQKGHRVFLEALAQLTTGEYTATIVGSGPLESALKAYATTLGVDERITWQSAVTDVVPMYAAADIVVIPSLWEGFGLVALEAMASGRVVVAADTGGLSSLIQSGRTGYLAAPGDPAALARQLTAVLAMSAEQCIQIGQAARTWATTHGDITTMADRYLQIYQIVEHQTI